MMYLKLLFRFSLLLLALAGLWVFNSFPTGSARADIIKREKITITTTGSAGSASGSATTSAVICGQIVRVDVDYHASTPATADITLKEVDDQIDTSVVTKADSTTDAQYYPTVQLTASDGTARTMDGTRPLVNYYPVCDRMIASLAQGDALTGAAVVMIYWKE